MNIIVIFIIVTGVCEGYLNNNGQENAENYSGEWIVRLKDTDENVAQLLALELGFYYGGKVYYYICYLVINCF